MLATTGTQTHTHTRTHTHIKVVCEGSGHLLLCLGTLRWHAIHSDKAHPRPTCKEKY